MEASDQTGNTEDQIAAREAALAERERAILEKESQLTADEQSIVDRQKAAQDALPKEAPTTPEEVQALSHAFAEYRKEVAALRNELAAHRRRAPVTNVPQETPEDRERARMELIADHTHYCPGCGALGKYPQRCQGTPSGPHAPIEMVSTEELAGDPQNHTAAPSTDPDELAA